MALLIPDLVYRDDAFVEGLAVEFDERTGRITRIVDPDEEDAPTDGADRRELIRLPGRALMPGFINVHSHAFQRVIRGRTQWRPRDASISDFWTWREAMYRAALGLSADDIYHVSRFCFLEMLRAGITTVGEFHYLHNDEDGHPYTDRAELARLVIAAADSVGIRICLLNCCYAAGGIGRPLRDEQRRFATSDVDEYLQMTEKLASDVVGNPLVTVGVAPHSVRAVSREWVRMLHAWASTRDMPFHMHVSEQPAEVDASLEAYGLRPVEMLGQDSILDDRFTGVHATHINRAEVEMLAHSGSTVCACPTTERDLGDGYLRAHELLRAGGAIALGSDSQSVIDLFEEARLVEYNERLQRLERVILSAEGAARREPAPALVRMATSAGARSLRLDTGMLEPGAFADIIAIDLDHMVLAGWTKESLSALVMLSAPADVVCDVWVGGRRVVSDRQHAMQEDATRAFTIVSSRR